MRPWHTLGAVCGALAVTATLTATPAQAVQVATGSFTYRYTDLDGQVRTRSMQNPTAALCITIEEAADPASTRPAFAPHNDTDWWTMVYDDAVCAGDARSLRPHGITTGDRLKLRSVKFLYR
ncbi:hypothetical protein ACIA8O_12565 [Kitasatospora sp. NPDC051853]|uniref:hypothetical protein n=1 Tax=Kitasatospora sp. NPDC051853 TaxID=3364058 RepID=UPI003787985E